MYHSESSACIAVNKWTLSYRLTTYTINHTTYVIFLQTNGNKLFLTVQNVLFSHTSGQQKLWTKRNGLVDPLSLKCDLYPLLCKFSSLILDAVSVNAIISNKIHIYFTYRTVRIFKNLFNQQLIQVKKGRYRTCLMILGHLFEKQVNFRIIFVVFIFFYRFLKMPRKNCKKMQGWSRFFKNKFSVLLLSSR